VGRYTLLCRRFDIWENLWSWLDTLETCPRYPLRLPLARTCVLHSAGQLVYENLLDNGVLNSVNLVAYPSPRGSRLKWVLHTAKSTIG